MTAPGRLAVARGMACIRAFAKWSADCRRDLGHISQSDVGKSAGVSQGAISRIESGNCTSIALVTYIAVHNFYQDAAAATGVALAVTPNLLHEPHTWTGPPLDAARIQWLRLWDTAPIRLRPVLLACSTAMLDATHAATPPGEGAVPTPGVESSDA